MENIYDLIIIGAGPAGMTAAIYASRGGLKTLMIDSEKPGGKLLITAKIENWPGIKFITGNDLAKEMFEHSISFGAEFINDDVLKIELNENEQAKDTEVLKTVVCKNNRYKAPFIIIGTGTKERKLKIKDEAKFEGKGLSYCAVCDAPLCKEEVVTVVGGGNSALEEAIYITKFAKQVNIIHRRDEFRAENHIVEEVKNHPKINLLTKYTPLEIVGDDSGFVKGLKIEHVETKEIVELDNYMIFPYVGSDASTSFLEGLNIFSTNGYIKVNDQMETEVPGIYSIGDVNDKELRQIVTAASDGAIAAQAIVRANKKRKK